MKKHYSSILLLLGICLSGQAADLVWSPANALWDTSSVNWSNTATTLPSAFTSGDNVLFNDAGSSQPVVKLVGTTLSAGNVVVDASIDYTLRTNTTSTDRISSLNLLTKRGAGNLIIDSDNTFSGPTTIDDGVLQLGSGGARGFLGSGPVTNKTGLVINRTGTLNIFNYLSGAGGFTNKLNATVNIRGTNTMSGPIVIQVGHFSLSNATSFGSSSDIILDASTTSTANSRLGLTGGIDLPAGTTITMLGTASAGPSRCTVQTPTSTDTTTNSVSGPILVGSGDGLVQLSGVSTGTGLLKVNGHVSNHPDNATPFAGSFYLRGAGNGNLSGVVDLPQAKLIKTDNGTFMVSSTGNSFIEVLIAVGTLRLGADHALPSVTFSIGQATGTNAILDLNGFNQQLPGVTTVHASNPNLPIIANSSTTSDSTLAITTPAGVYGGMIQDSILGGTRKVGLLILSGAQQLTTNCTYSGPSTILGGGLSLVGWGSISNTTPLVISNGAALDVRYRTNGTPVSTLPLQPAQTLRGDGIMNIAGNLLSQGTIELKVNKSISGSTFDSVALGDPDNLITCQMTYGGTLKLDLSGDPLAATDSFKLFDAAAYTGAFTSIQPKSPGFGLTWDTSTLTSDGTLRIGTIATNPTNITAQVVAGGLQMKIAWPEDHTGWMLQVQTNALNVGLRTNWFDVTGSDKTNQIFQSINSSAGCVFYRLYYQP